MGSNLRTRETLLMGEGENRSYNEIIEASAPYGWHTFDQALVDCFAQRLITEETAMIFSTSKSKVRPGSTVPKSLEDSRRPPSRG